MYHATDYTIPFSYHHHSVYASLPPHKDALAQLCAAFTTVVFVLTIPCRQPLLPIHVSKLCSLFQMHGYTINSTQVPAPSSGTVHNTSMVLFIIKDFFHIHPIPAFTPIIEIENDMPSPLDLTASDAPSIPVVASFWNSIIEYTCRHILAPYLSADAENRMSATIFHTKPSPKHQDWIVEYTADNDTKLMMNYVQKHDKPMPPDMINSLDRCYHMHLREDRVHFRHQKLI